MKRAFQIFKRDMRRLARNPVAMIVVAGVCLLRLCTHGLILLRIWILMGIQDPFRSQWQIWIREQTMS